MSQWASRFIIVRGYSILLMTYGEVTGWYRNIEPTGRCCIQWQGKSFLARKSEYVDAAYALPLFHLPLQLALRLAEIRQFVRLARM
jgi:hypothetical protein